MAASLTAALVVPTARASSGPLVLPNGLPNIMGEGAWRPASPASIRPAVSDGTASGGYSSRTPQLVAPDGQDGGQFGASLDVDGDTMVIGSWGGGNDAQGRAYVSTRQSGGWSAPVPLNGVNAESGDDFGWDVALSGDHLVVGSRYDSEPNNVAEPLQEVGSVSFFRRSGQSWTAGQTVYSPAMDEGSAFGFAVDMLGEYALVGEPGYDDLSVGRPEQGAAYVYRRNSSGTWSLVQALELPDAAAGDVFGARVALAQDGSQILAYVAALGADDRGEASGAVYAYVRDGSGQFNYSAKLLASNGSLGAQFGFSLAAQGRRVLVGAPGQILDGVENAGSVYVFERNGNSWTQRASLREANAASSQFLGFEVALDGDRALLANANPPDSIDVALESVSMWQRNGSGDWSRQSSLRPAEPLELTAFGSGLAIEGDELFVGAAETLDAQGDAVGSIYLFDASSVAAPLWGWFGISSLALGLLGLGRRSRRQRF